MNKLSPKRQAEYEAYSAQVAAARKATFEQIVSTLNAGGIVQVSTCLRSTVYEAKHVGMFRFNGKSMFVQRGKSWDCIDGTSIRYGRMVQA